MAVPKRKHSNSRTGKRRSHGANGLRYVTREKTRDGQNYRVQLTECSQCRTAIPTHVVCPNCGGYGGRTTYRSVVDMTD
ncbi:MAG: 50S ribosomal protein L32 [Planctomycetaceae bacterium]|nr:50S ribosomal protein L32 [Planctomycetaceae bacterium]